MINSVQFFSEVNVFGGRRMSLSTSDQLNLSPAQWGMEIRTTYPGSEGRTIVVPWSNVRSYEVRAEEPKIEEDEPTLVGKKTIKATVKA